MSIRDRILDAEQIERILTRIAHEILERNKRTGDLVLVAIETGGTQPGKRIAERLREIESREIPLGFLDITLYRDDLSTKTNYPVVGETRIPFSIEGKDVILIDDVIFTGRTIRAALEALMDFGRPHTVQLAALIDRGHREIPIRPDFVGRVLTTARRQRVHVNLSDDHATDEVVIEDPGDESASGGEG